MKLIVNKKQIDSNPEQFLRQAGYGFIVDRKSGKDSFVKRLSSNFYPRLHMYVKKIGEDKIVFDLHIDQQSSSFKGVSRHKSEYDSPIVQTEIERLKSLVLNSLR